MRKSSSLSVIILAAGKGTRMKSETAKVLHEVFFAPMVQHVVNAVLPLDPLKIVAVVGHQREAVQASLAHTSCHFAIQELQQGTGHAVLAAEGTLGGTNNTIMILCGDTPLIASYTLAKMYAQHQERQATLTVMTTTLPDPTNYGRILSDDEGNVCGIVEQKDASPEQLAINEINAGIYCVESNFLFSALHRVGTNNSQNEVYLTDIVSEAVLASIPVEKFLATSASEVLGVNSRVELAEAHRHLQLQRNHQLMLDGVTIFDPQTVTVSPQTLIAKDTILESFVRLSGKCQIGPRVVIGQGSILNNCLIEEGVILGPYCCLSNKTISANRKLEPFSVS